MTLFPDRCGICGRELVDRADAYGPGDPRINCGGDCLACMWSVEEDAGETRARRPDEFETGMDDDRVWQPGGEDPRPFFVLSTAEVKLLTGDLSAFDGDAQRGMEAVLELDQRLRDWLAADPAKR